MTREEANTRLVLSRHTLAVYRQNGLPTGPVEGVMKMIDDEVAVLERIVFDYPTKASTVGKLIENWRAIADQVKVRAH